MKPIYPLIFVLFVICQTTQGQTAFINENIADIKVIDSNQELYVFLEPNQTRETIKINDMCLVNLRDTLAEITIPFGKTFKMQIPFGYKYFVPSGIYTLENRSENLQEYVLVAPNKCN